VRLNNRQHDEEGKSSGRVRLLETRQWRPVPRNKRKAAVTEAVSVHDCKRVMQLSRVRFTRAFPWQDGIVGAQMKTSPHRFPFVGKAHHAGKARLEQAQARELASPLTTFSDSMRRARNIALLIGVVHDRSIA
jgi:hypothetical protein